MSRPAIVKLYRQKANGTLAVLIPEGIRKELDLTAGRQFVVYTEKGRMVLEPLERFERGKLR